MDSVRMSEVSVMRPFNWVLGVILAAAAAYFVVTGYAGYLVGKGIDDAKRQNLLVAVGTTVIGRHTTENLALHQAKLPDYITQSPTFWMILRLTE
jgi:hypothetical protein